jgi:hypothetical protein
MWATLDMIHGNSLRKDDWDAAQADVLILQAQGKVIYYQPYAPKKKDCRKRPFVVVFQDDFMRSVAQRFSHGNSWALDSTFKTNQYDLPLYAAIVPNQDGKGMPVFYMLRTKDNKQGHKRIALELALVFLFASIGDTCSTTIVVDKHKISLNAINKVVQALVHCWSIQSGERVQVAGKILLCHFHIMKAWSENLFTQILIHDIDRLWRALHVLIHCPNEDHFETNLRKLFVDFQHVPSVEAYIKNGWAGEHVLWKKLWPRFGRLFAYSSMDSTNHVEQY